MKITAHPLMVAVAMGLLGPAVLADEDHREETHQDKRHTSKEDVLAALESDDGPAWARLTIRFGASGGG